MLIDFVFNINENSCHRNGRNTRPLKAQELRVNMQLSCENLLMFYNWVVILKIVDSKVL
jgi:hypothetical protein